MSHGGQVVNCSRHQKVLGVAHAKLPFTAPAPHSQSAVSTDGYGVMSSACNLNNAHQDVVKERLRGILGFGPSVPQPSKFPPSPAASRIQWLLLDPFWCPVSTHGDSCDERGKDLPMPLG